VLRYRFFLEESNLAASTINVQLAAVRRLAYEAADTGLLSPELAAGIARVKGAKRLGVRIRNWLTAEQGKTRTASLPGSAVQNICWPSVAVAEAFAQENGARLQFHHFLKSCARRVFRPDNGEIVAWHHFPPR
jgi:hypothetical protein